MRRPTRTRRLTIAAKVSLLAFMIVAAVGVRSYRTSDRWNLGGRRIMLIHGRVLDAYDPADAAVTFPVHESYSAVNPYLPELFLPPKWSFAGFSWSDIENVTISNCKRSTELCLGAPLWFPLLLLLISPVRWLIAPRVAGAAFPVVTDVNPVPK